MIYNMVMRRWPVSMYKGFADSGCLFTNTIHALLSALTKISRIERIPCGSILYRGLGGLGSLPTWMYPNNRHLSDRQGYMELGFMSTTTDRGVAVQYSGILEGRPIPGVMEIVVGTSDRPGFLPQCCSQYPCERERVWLPGALVEPVGEPHVIPYSGKGVVTFFPVRVINNRFRTVEQIRDQRKTMHIGNCRYNISMLDLQLRRVSSPSLRPLLANVLDQLRSKMSEQASRSVDDFNDDVQYRGLILEMLELHSTVKRAFNLAAPTK
jgi:hypothetical protein